MPMEDLFTRFHTNPQVGLSSASIADARTQYGENKLTPPKQPSYFWLLFKELFVGFNCILWFAGVLAFLAYKPFGEPFPSITNLALGVVLFLVITVNSILNVYQQLKSIKIVASFSKLLPTLATVRRDGHEQQVVTSELVPGDIILIRMGDKLPADCRFIASDGLKVTPLFSLIDRFPTCFFVGEYIRVDRGIQTDLGHDAMHQRQLHGDDQHRFLFFHGRTRNGRSGGDRHG